MQVGIVVIGRNEGERLRTCLASALASEGAIVVYVDSGSTDGSQDRAAALGAHVLNLDLSRPFTAARARNEGMSKLIEIDAVEFVQFMDGDCELQPGWISHALNEFSVKPRAAVVCGRRRERNRNASIYNRLCDMEWSTPVGRAKSCGGDAMMRISALMEVGGFNSEIIAGEEPELCVRLRKAMWEIWRTEAEMTLHDAAMTNFGQWWKRNYRAGHAYAEGYDRHGARPEEFRRKEVRSNYLWGTLCLIPLTWPLVFLLALRVTQTRLGKRRNTLFDSLLYGFSTALGKLPQMLGQRRYFANKRSGQRDPIIEYKSVTA